MIVNPFLKLFGFCQILLSVFYTSGKFSHLCHHQVIPIHKTGSHEIDWCFSLIEQPVTQSMINQSPFIFRRFDILQITFGSRIHLTHGFDITGITIKIRGHNEDGRIPKRPRPVGIPPPGSRGNTGYIAIRLLRIDHIFHPLGIYIPAVIIEHTRLLHHKAIRHPSILFTSGAIGRYPEQITQI